MRDRFLWIQIGLIALLSVMADYHIPDLSQSNWETVLFLTPLGIVNNYFQKENSVLWSFYSDVSTGQVEFSAITMAVLFGLYLAMIFNVWKWLQHFRVKK